MFRRPQIKTEPFQLEGDLPCREKVGSRPEGGKATENQLKKKRKRRDAKNRKGEIAIKIRGNSASKESKGVARHLNKMVLTLQTIPV